MRSAMPWKKNLVIEPLHLNIWCSDNEHKAKKQPQHQQLDLGENKFKKPDKENS